jgi:hypothetical protein
MRNGKISVSDQRRRNKATETHLGTPSLALDHFFPPACDAQITFQINNVLPPSHGGLARNGYVEEHCNSGMPIVGHRVIFASSLLFE